MSGKPNKISREQEKASIHYATLSNTIVLVLIGFFLLLFFHVNSITSIIKEKINVLVELRDDVTPQQIEQILNFLNREDRLVEESVRVIPEEQAAQLMGDDFIISLDEIGNPFRKMISFNVKSNYYTDLFLAEIAGILRNSEGVHDVFYENVVIDQVKENIQKFSFGILSLAIIFVFLAVVIIYNTINLSMYADRWEIKTMEIIGARDNFIRQPYLKIAAKIAIRSFFLASVFTLMVLIVIWMNFPLIAEIVMWQYLILSFVLILIISLSITLIATIRIVNSYLYKHEKELYF
jgi:cell division transport system permease protein